MREEDVPGLAALLRESLENGRRPNLTITSNSMSPLLRKGDQIILSATPISQLNCGDVISVEYDRFILTHRYWYNKNSKIITRGDHSLHFDPPAPQEKYIGRVIIRKRKGKFINVQTGYGKLLNDHLGWLVRMEQKLWRHERTWHATAVSDTGSNWGQIQLHRLIFLWGHLTTFLLEPLASEAQLNS